MQDEEKNQAGSSGEGEQHPPAAPAAGGRQQDPEAAGRAPEPPSLELAQLQEAWRRSILPALERRSIPASAMLAVARPAELSGDMLTLEFPRASAFNRERSEEPKVATLLLEALFEVTGRHLQLAFATGEAPVEPGDGQDHPVTEQQIVELVKSTFDAQELDV